MYIDGKLRPACLSIHTGRIGGVHSYTYMKEEALDAGDWLVLPGAIDVHVHMREPEYPKKEDFTTGSIAAVAGGVSTYLDMPCYNSPCTNTVGALTTKERLAATKSVCDFGFHFGATNENSDLIKRLQPHSLKGFLSETHSHLTMPLSGFERHFSAYDKTKPFLCHCEDPDIIEQCSAKYNEHEKSHPPKAALVAVKNINKLARKYSRRVHFCHLTTAAEVEAAKQGNKPLAQNALGEKRDLFTCEVTPHHLFLSTSDLPNLKQMGVCNPALRQKADVAKLWKCINNIDCIASDHAPHTVAEKEKGAAGFPGVQTMIPLLLHAVLGKKLGINKAVEMFAEAPAKNFTLYRKGRIAPGYDADLIMFDTQQNWKVSTNELYSKAGWSPYEGWCLRGKILGTFVRGEQAYWDGEILVRPGYGERVQRTAQIGTERLVLRKHSKER